ncbi:cysteine proteinase, partial [Suhomyces tanzawaensis NRRL Y-17324]
SDSDLEIIAVNQLGKVTNDYHILHHHYATPNPINNSILVDDPSNRNTLRSLVTKRIQEYSHNSTPSNYQYGTDFLISKTFLQKSNYQDHYRPVRPQHDEDAEEEAEDYDDLLNLTIHETPTKKYHQSILNYYVPSKPISSTNYSILDSLISNFFIDKQASSQYEKSHLKTQDAVTKNRIQSLSKITPLDNSQLSQVMNIWNSRINKQLFSIFQIDVFVDDLKTLRDGKWLNDNIIDLYLNLITDSTPKTYAWTTHFFTTLQDKGYQGVARWAKRRKLNVYEKDIILVPINIMNTHWALAVINNVEQKIEYLDSLSSNGNINAIKLLSNYMSLEADRLGKPKIQYQLFPSVKTPQQANGYDCGVFTCTAARYVAEKSALTYSQSDMKVIRRIMAYEILTKKLIE